MGLGLGSGEFMKSFIIDPSGNPIKRVFVTFCSFSRRFAKFSMKTCQALFKISEVFWFWSFNDQNPHLQTQVKLMSFKSKSGIFLTCIQDEWFFCDLNQKKIFLLIRKSGVNGNEWEL